MKHRTKIGIAGYGTPPTNVSQLLKARPCNLTVDPTVDPTTTCHPLTSSDVPAMRPKLTGCEHGFHEAR